MCFRPAGLLVCVVLLSSVAGPPRALADPPLGHSTPKSASPPRAHAHKEGAHGQAAVPGAPGEPSAVGRTVRIEAQDIAFDQAQIAVGRGETVRFVVTNTGELVHDFTIGTAAAQAAHRREMTAMLEEQSRADPAAVLPHDDPNAVMLAPGETRELIWSFPDEPMTLEFACNVPGHYEAGMKGALVVR